MEWKSEYETGIGEIDAQHKTIIQLVTEFEAAVNSDMHWNGLYPLVTRAKEYAKFHFSVEESLMQIFMYPRLSAHRSEHNFVLKNLTDLEGRVLKKEIKDDLIQGFRTWLLGHFLESDRHFVAFMRKATPVIKGASTPNDEVAAESHAKILEQAMSRALGREQKVRIGTDHRTGETSEWIAWGSLVKTNHIAMDTDHQTLLNLFNGLAEAVVAGKGEGECTLMLDGIVEHARKHFASEEELMKKHDYPQAAAHSAEHAGLLDQALKYRAKFLSGFNNSHLPLVYFHEDWLTRHIARMDKPLAEFLATIG